jgi:hypothetical protein
MRSSLIFFLLKNIRKKVKIHLLFQLLNKRCEKGLLILHCLGFDFLSASNCRALDQFYFIFLFFSLYPPSLRLKDEEKPEWSPATTPLHALRMSPFPFRWTWACSLLS